MSNRLTPISERKWNASAMRYAMFLFKHHGVNVVTEHQSRPRLPSIIKAKNAGEDWRALLKVRDQSSREVPTGFTLWHEEEDGEKVVCYFAECPQKLVNTILHASTCGCEGCWGRMQNPKSFLETRDI